MDNRIVLRYGKSTVECRKNEDGWSVGIALSDENEAVSHCWLLPGVYFESQGMGLWWNFDDAVLVEGSAKNTHLRLTGRNEHAEYALNISGPESDGRWRMSLHLDVPADLSLGRLELRGLLHIKPDFVFTPNLRPDDDHVIADHTYRSPVAVLQEGCICLSVIPDLDTLRKSRPIPTAMDLNLQSSEPYLSHGFCNWTPVPHVFYSHDVSIDSTMPAGHHELCVLVQVAGDTKPQEGFRASVRDMWERWGQDRFQESEAPKRVSYSKYAHYAYDGELADSFYGFELDGLPVGGLRINREYPGDIWNQAWFSDLRSAFGMRLWADRWSDGDLKEKAHRILNLALSAPQKSGLFPNIYVTEKGTSYDLILRGGAVRDFSKKPSYTELLDQFLDEKSFRDDPDLKAGWVGSQSWGGAPDWYSTVDMSWTAYWLVRWFSEIEEDERIPPFVTEYAERLCELQAHNGSIPSYLHRRDQRALPRLKESASSSASGLFLALWGGFLREERYVEAARRVAGFIESDVLPERKWFDYETFYSCASKPEGFYDHHTLQHPQNSLSMLWTARLYLQLYRADGHKKWLESACVIADYIALLQQVWDCSFLRLTSFGGYGVQNCDGEWNDARQCYMATLFCELGETTGSIEYAERGEAALRASFALICCPENEANYGELQSEHTGWSDENYAHGGLDTKAGHSSFNWGSGSAAASAVMCPGIEPD